MAAVDRLNGRYGKGSVLMGSSGLIGERRVCVLVKFFRTHR